MAPCQVDFLKKLGSPKQFNDDDNIIHFSKSYIAKGDIIKIQFKYVPRFFSICNIRIDTTISYRY